MAMTKKEAKKIGELVNRIVVAHLFINDLNESAESRAWWEIRDLDAMIELATMGIPTAAPLEVMIERRDHAVGYHAFVKARDEAAAKVAA